GRRRTRVAQTSPSARVGQVRGLVAQARERVAIGRRAETEEIFEGDLANLLALEGALDVPAKLALERGQVVGPGTHHPESASHADPLRVEELDAQDPLATRELGDLVRRGGDRVAAREVLPEAAAGDVPMSGACGRDPVAGPLVEFEHAVDVHRATSASTRR